jgi:hypothetical protein
VSLRADLSDASDLVSDEDVVFVFSDAHGLLADIDILSTSAVHQSVQHVDFSLKIQPKKKTAATPASTADVADSPA